MPGRRIALLYQSERWQEAIDVYDQVLTGMQRIGPLREMVLKPDTTKLGFSCNCGDSKTRCAHVMTSNGNSARIRAVRVATTALEADGYRGLREYKKALKACDKVVDLVGSESDVVSRRWLAAALAVKAQTLWALRPGNEALSWWADV